MFDQLTHMSIPAGTTRLVALTRAGRDQLASRAALRAAESLRMGRGAR